MAYLIISDVSTNVSPRSLTNSIIFFRFFYVLVLVSAALSSSEILTDNDRNFRVVSFLFQMATSAPKPPKGHFNVLYFASASSFTAIDHESFPGPLGLDQLFELLDQRYPGIRDGVLSSCLVTVNLEYVQGPVEGENCDVWLHEGDEVAIIPPVSSG